MLNPIYDPLYVIDVNETRYYLADSYEVSEDGMQITVKLKEGLKWHDGEAITADDMIFTMDVCSCLLYTSPGDRAPGKQGRSETGKSVS